MSEEIKFKDPLELVEVQCLYCSRKELMPAMENAHYSKWPIIHNACSGGKEIHET